MFPVPPSPDDPPIESFSGRWYFCDDGWLGTLILDTVGEHDLAGTFASERFDDEYRVTARVGTVGPGTIEVDIHEFNWMPFQRYRGRLFTRAPQMIAGSSRWKDVPFGFFAGRGAHRPLGGYRAGTVREDDFAGSWTAYLDGEPNTIILEFDRETRVLRGSCTGSSGEYEVTGRPGDVVPHEVSLTLRVPGDRQVAAVLSGYLMSRPKSAISGIMTVVSRNAGFVMIRYA